MRRAGDEDAVIGAVLEGRGVTGVELRARIGGSDLAQQLNDLLRCQWLFRHGADAARNFELRDVALVEHERVRAVAHHDGQQTIELCHVLVERTDALDHLSVDQEAAFRAVQRDEPLSIAVQKIEEPWALERELQEDRAGVRGAIDQADLDHVGRENTSVSAMSSGTVRDRNFDDLFLRDQDGLAVRERERKEGIGAVEDVHRPFGAAVMASERLQEHLAGDRLSAVGRDDDRAPVLLDAVVAHGQSRIIEQRRAARAVGHLIFLDLTASSGASERRGLPAASVRRDEGAGRGGVGGSSFRR